MTWRPLKPPAGEQDPHKLGPSLDRVARRLGAPTAKALTGLFGRWEEMVGPGIAAHAKPVALRAGRLTIAVDSAAWASQLRFLGPELVQRCCDELGEGTVAQIEVRVASEGAPRRARNEAGKAGRKRRS